MTVRPTTNTPADRAIAAQALAALAVAAPEARVLRRSLRPAPRAHATRRRRVSTLGSRTQLNLTPMIDVVFQLLVFFIATTRMVTNEDVLRMDLPPRTAVEATGAASAAQPDPFAYIEDALRIEVRRGGALNCRAPVASASTVRELRPLLESARRDSANPNGALPPTFPIVIAPVDNATWQDAIEVLNAAAGAGYRNVSFEQRPGVRATP